MKKIIEEITKEIPDNLIDDLFTIPGFEIISDYYNCKEGESFFYHPCSFVCHPAIYDKIKKRCEEHPSFSGWVYDKRLTILDKRKVKAND